MTIDPKVLGQGEVGFIVGLVGGKTNRVKPGLCAALIIETQIYSFY